MTTAKRTVPFITIEGVDGAGKSSHIPAIVQALEEHGWTVVSSREPGGTPLGEQLRAMVLNDQMALTTEVLLAFASRAEHLEQVIRPALARGEAVVCDRFTDSTFAYQGAGRGMNKDELRNLERLVHHDLQPDLTLLFDLPVDVAKQRLGGTGKDPDKFESQSATFFTNVQNGYHERIREAPHRFVVIDSSVPLVDVSAQVRQALQTFLTHWSNTQQPEATARRPRP